MRPFMVWHCLGARLALLIALVTSTTTLGNEYKASLGAGDSHTCVLGKEGVRCFGDAYEGQTGRDTDVTVGHASGDMAGVKNVAFSMTERIVALSSGIQHNAALFHNGKVALWGYGGHGALGYGNTNTLGDDNNEMGTVPFLPLHPAHHMDYIIQVSTGWGHTCIVVHTGKVKCWGEGSWGKLGTNADANIGDGVGEVDALPYITFADTVPATQVAAGFDHTCVLFDNKQLRCFGYGVRGALGSDAATNTYDGGINVNMNALPYVLSITGAVQVAASAHTCALLQSKEVRCWGPNDDGQLGRDNTVDIGMAGGNMATVGDIAFNTVHGAILVTCGAQHTCVLFDNYGVRCFGNNTYGQLTGTVGSAIGANGGDMAGLGFVSIPDGTSQGASSVIAGSRHTCVTLHSPWMGSRKVRCWGDGFYGQLGGDNPQNNTMDNDVSLPGLNTPAPYSLLPPTFADNGGYPLQIFGPFSRQLFWSQGGAVSTLSVAFTDTTTGAIYNGTCLPFTTSGSLECSSPVYTLAGVTSATASVGLRVNSSYIYDLQVQARIHSVSNITNGTLVPHKGPVVGGSEITFTSPLPLSQADSRYCTIDDPISGSEITTRATLVGSTVVKCEPLDPVASPRTLNAAMYFSLGFPPLNITFDMYNAPSLNAVFPTSGPIGGGSTVTVTGTGLTDQGFGAVLRFISYNGTYVDVKGTLNTTTQSIVALVPNLGSTVNGQFLLPGNLLTTVSLNGGYDFTNQTTVPFGVFSNPTLKSVSPPALPAGTSAVVTLVGSGFYNSPNLQVRIQSPSVKIIVNGTYVAGTVTAAIPASPNPLLGYIEVTFNGVQYTDSRTVFSYYAVTSVSPQAGSIKGGTVVQVTGNGYLKTGALACKFGTRSDLATYISATRMSCISPPVTVPTTVTVSSALDQVAGLFANSTAAFTYFIDPETNAMWPTVGPASQNTTITLNGTYFSSTTGLVTKCRVDDIVFPARLANGTLQCDLLPGTGSHSVFFTLNGLDYIDSGQTFTYYLPYGIEPVLGPSIGGSEVVLFGQGFDSSISFCKFGTAITTPSSVSAVQIKCTAPPHPPGNVFLEVSSDNVTYTNGKNNFTFFAQPTITSLTPVSGSEPGGLTVTIYGTLFQEYGVATKCRFGQQVVPFSILSPTSGTCVTPAGSGIVNVAISLNDGAGFTTDLIEFMYTVILTVSPNSGPTSGGTLVTVSGSGFEPALASALTCKFGSGVAIPAKRLDPVRATCEAPAHGAATVFVTLSSNGIEWGTSGPGYTYYETPVTDAFTPVHGRGSGGSLVTITGSNFINVPSIVCKFGATESQLVKFTSASAIVCQSPPGTGTTKLSLSFNKLDFASPKEDFTFFTMFDINPRHGPVSGGTVIDISGTGFAGGPSESVRCKVGFQDVAGRMISKNLIRCITPPVNQDKLRAMQDQLHPLESSSEVTVTVNGIDYQSSSPLSIFTYYDEPKVTGVSPSSGPTYGGSLVTIFGSGFQSRVGLSCRFGDDVESVGQPATYMSSTAVVCKSHSHAAAVTIPEISMNAFQFHKGVGTNFTFVPCQPGFYSEAHTVPCQPCPLGTAVGRAGSRSCPKCSLDGYADMINQTRCTPCPANSRISSFLRNNITLCECLPGFYEPDGQSGRPCLECPVGAICEGKTTPPYPAPKYWQSDLQSEVFIKCANIEACPGGKVQPCEEGYEGRQCSACKEGFYANGDQCLKCTSLNFAMWGLLGGFICLSAMVILALTGRRSSCYTATLHMLAYYAQAMVLIMSLPYEWPTVVNRAYLWAASPFVWGVDALAGECFMPFWGFGAKLIFMASLPGAYAVVFGFYYFLNRTFGWKRGHAEWHTLRDSHIDAFIFLLSIVYFVLLVNILKVFDCSPSPDGIETLDAAPGQECFDTWWWLVAPTAAGFLFLYGIGVPAFLYSRLRRAHGRLHPTMLYRYGSVLNIYKLNAPLWEIYTMFEKFIFASTIMFSTGFPVFQGLTLLALIVCGLGLVSVHRPYYIERHNSVQVFMRWNLCIVLLMGMVFRIGDFPTNTIKTFATVTCLAILGCSLMVSLGLAIFDIHVIWIALKRNPKKSAIGICPEIFHPRGKTTLLEWLASRPENVDEMDLIQYFEVHEVIEDLVEYCAPVPPLEASDDMWTLADQSLSAYCSHLCWSHTIPLIREQITGLVMDIRETNDFEKMRKVFLFYSLFGELARYTQYGETEEAIRSIPGFEDLDFHGIEDKLGMEEEALPGLDQLGEDGLPVLVGSSGSEDDETTSTEGDDDDATEVELEYTKGATPRQSLEDRSERGYIADILWSGWNTMSSYVTPKNPKLADTMAGDLPAASPRPGASTAAAGAVSIPEFSTQEHAQEFVNAKMTPIDLHSQEALAIKGLVETTSVSHAGHPPETFEVTEILRIDNQRLTRRFMETRQDILTGIKASGSDVGQLSVNDSLLLAPSVNEYYLWHGANATTLDSVVQDGFQPGLSNLSGMFGAGTYFAEHFSKSHQYVHTAQCDISGAIYGHKNANRVTCTCRNEQDLGVTEYEILLCRVVLGDAYHATDLMKRTRVAPLKPDSKSARYDSIFAAASATNPEIKYKLAYNEFIVFDKAQALPAFIVKYRNLGS